MSKHTFKNQRKTGRHFLRRAATTVEFAMVAPVIFLMVFGSFEFARMMMVRQAMTNAAREGCRNACLATTRNSSDSEAVIRDTLGGVIAKSDTCENLRVDITPSFDSVPEAGTKIQVTVEIDCSDVSWLPPFFTSGSKIQGSAVMSRE